MTGRGITDRLPAESGGATSRRIRAPRSSKRTTFRSLMIAWLIVVLLIVALVFLFSQGLPGEAWLYLGILVAASLLCLYFARAHTFSVALGRGVDLFEIPVYLSFTGLVLIALFGLAPYFDSRYFLLRGQVQGMLPSGLLLTAVGLIVMWIAYACMVAVLKRRITIQQPKEHFAFPSLPASLALCIALVVLRLVLYREGGATLDRLGALEQPVLYLLEVPWLLLALFILQANMGRWPRWLFLAVLAVEIVMAVLSGWSSALLKIVFIFIAGFSYAGKRISFRLLVLGVVAAFVFTPLTRSMREADLSTAEKVISSVIDSADTYWGSSNEGIMFNQNLLIGRQSGTAQIPGLILEMTPSVIPYRSSQELLSIPLSFLPRVLFASKLESSSKGSQFSVEYLGVSERSATATTMAGSSYLYGGWLVMMAMMAIAGVVFALTVYLIMVPAVRTGSVGMLALYVGLVIAVFHIGEGDIAGIWQGLIQRGVVFSLVMALLCVKGRSSGSRKSA